MFFCVFQLNLDLLLCLEFIWETFEYSNTIHFFALLLQNIHKSLNE